MWMPNTERVRNPAVTVGLFRRILNYRLLRRLGFNRKSAWHSSRNRCDYLRKKSEHKPWFVPGMLPKRLREVR
jgi:hypothetical protein